MLHLLSEHSVPNNTLSPQVWELTPKPSEKYFSHQPKYTLRTSFPVRRVSWRKGYNCEVAIVSNAESGGGISMEVPQSPDPSAVSSLARAIMPSPRIGFASVDAIEGAALNSDEAGFITRTDGIDPIEIWDVRRSYIAKWVLIGSAIEGGVTGA